MELAAPLPGQAMSLDDFLNWDQGDLGGAKFEWKDGELEPAGDWMKAAERKIVLNLDDRFRESPAAQSGARLVPETSCFLEAINATRIPDIAFFTLEQLRKSQNEGQPVPKWVIEIISPSDLVFETERKTKEYFDSGVELVWQIFPLYERVSILKSLNEAVIFGGDAVCSAAPVLAEFEISVADLFRDR